MPLADSIVDVDRSASRPVLVTGASGFIGGVIARELQRAGRRVVTVDIAGKPDRMIDVADPHLLSEVRRGAFQAVVHQAGISNTLERDESLLIEHNTTRPLALADACLGADVPLIYASSFSVYGRTGRRAVRESDLPDCSGPLNPYAASKLRLDTEMTIRYPDADWLGLRYTNVFGPTEPIHGRMSSVISQWLSRSANGEAISIFEGTEESGRDFVEVDRVAAVIAAKLDRPDGSGPRGVFNLGSGVTVTFGELIGWCREFSGATLAVQRIPFTVRSQYQHWTEADMSALRPYHPDLPWGDRLRLKAYAGSCWRSFRESR